LWSDKLVELLEAELGVGSTEAACAALGCIDPRTARKHVRTIRAVVDAKLPILAELLASAPGPSEGQTFPPGTNPFVILRRLWDRYLKAAQERSGSVVSAALRFLLWLGPGFESFRLFNRSCIPIAQAPW
jgi:hypothetical protein